jgi:hypothetical protein
MRACASTIKASRNFARRGASHDEVRIKPARPAHRERQVAERYAAFEKHADDHRLRQRDDDDVVEPEWGILRLRLRPEAERLDDLSAEQSRKVVPSVKMARPIGAPSRPTTSGTVSV